jgi:hypothetical protein
MEESCIRDRLVFFFPLENLCHYLRLFPCLYPCIRASGAMAPVVAVVVVVVFFFFFFSIPFPPSLFFVLLSGSPLVLMRPYHDRIMVLLTPWTSTPGERGYQSAPSTGDAR